MIVTPGLVQIVLEGGQYIIDCQHCYESYFRVEWFQWYGVCSHVVTSV